MSPRLPAAPRAPRPGFEIDQNPSGGHASARRPAESEGGGEGDLMGEMIMEQAVAVTLTRPLVASN